MIAKPAGFNPIGSQSPDPQEIAQHAEQSKNISAQLDCPNDWQNKTPAFSLARLGGPHAWDYPVCIDSGSSVSLIDDAFAREYLPYLTRNNAGCDVQLLGLGNTVATEWVALNLYFRSYQDNSFMIVPARFFLVPGIGHVTKIILGNDVLVPMRVRIDLGNRALTFPSMKGRIAIWCTMQGEVLAKPIAKVKESFVVKPQHVCMVPFEIEGFLPTANYLLEAEDGNNNSWMTARSVGSATAEQHFAQLMNPIDQPVTLQAGQVIGRLHATTNIRDSSQFYETNSVTGMTTDEQAFREVLPEFDINSELSQDEQLQMTAMLQANRQAFAYGNRKLGSTDWVKMTLDTGDAEPISSAPYHASPNGRRVIEETIAELLADD
ncbi:hypothetical protein NliqN6_2255, partial [Naganishia liquefaciens]